jgi:UDP-glucose 4-epimerase
MGKRAVVVTGGAGFIGCNIVDTLLRNGYLVTAIDDLSTGQSENLAPLMENKDFDFIKGSLLDSKLLKEIFRGNHYVIHEAAIPSVQRSIENPVATNEANVTGTLNVLMAAKDMSIEKVVMASSSSIYGDTPIMPKEEGMAPNPKSPYAVSKLTCEQYCRIFTEVYGLRTICLRYFNVFGPHQNPHSDYAAVIPKFMDAIANDRPITIFGDGTQTRDFTYVQNVVKANILAMESNVVGNFNIACGCRISLNDLANTMMSLMGKKVEIQYSAPRAGDVKHSLADITRAKTLLGYEPEFDLRYGLTETIKWFLNSKKRL